MVEMDCQKGCLKQYCSTFLDIVYFLKMFALSINLHNYLKYIFPFGLFVS